MKTLIAFLALTGPAFAAGPTQGTFAGQTTRGEVVQSNHDQYGTGKDGAFGNKVSEQAQTGERGTAVQNQIGRDTEVGYGSNK